MRSTVSVALTGERDELSMQGSTEPTSVMFPEFPSE